MSFIKIEEGDLEAFVAGDASAEVMAAIHNSAEHQQRATEFEQIDSFLSELFTEVKPLDSQYLVDVASGQASANQRLIVAAHCRRDPAVKAELERLEASWQEMMAPENPEPSLMQGIPGLFQSLLKAQPLLAGGGFARNTRSPQISDSQSHEVDDLGVVVTIRVIPPPVGEIWQLKGRITQENKPLVSANVILDWEEGEIDPCQTDDIGSFSFDNLSEGTYTLYVALPDNIIEIPNIELAEEDD